MYYAQITNGTVTAVTQTADYINSPNMVLIDGLRDIGGYSYNADTGEFTPPEPASTVPQVVSMRQARLALLITGRLAAVAEAIHGIQDEGQKQAAQIEWEYATEVRRDHWLINGLTPALGMTQADLDDLFVAAAAL